ncbi:MAG: nucleotide-binding protein [Bacteroidia bacterium]|nr:nucleotide-binding protein [Bacteroidia bacterium]
MKIRIFIGSSSEGIKIARQTKTFLEKTLNAECIVWENIGVFEYNKSTFEALLKGRLLYDFAILVATKDDIVWWRRMVDSVPRDNVIFEFGLYLGALGDTRTLLLQEGGVKLPTDLNGITLPRFSVKKNNLESKLSEVAGYISKSIKHNEFHLLPSTALAVGYFNSFLKSATAILMETKDCVKIKDANYSCKRIKVIIPETLSDDIAEKAKLFFDTHAIEISEIQNGKRPFKVQFAYDSSDKNNIVIVDMPFTLNTIRPCCTLLLKKSNIGVGNSQQLVEQREILNFKSTLENLIEQNDYCKKVVSIMFESKYTK